MINFTPFRPSVSTTKVAKQAKAFKSTAVAGSKVGDENQHVVPSNNERRKKKDRRQRDIKPLIDMRSGDDRRQVNARRRVDVKV